MMDSQNDPFANTGPRELFHERVLRVCGFRREDGLFEIEASLVDTKTHDMLHDGRGEIPAGEPLHEMHVRVVYGRDMVIRSAIARMAFTPFPTCAAAEIDYRKLAGLTLGPGFIRSAMERMGGNKGCTHLRDMLLQLSAVAFSTMATDPRNDSAEGAGSVGLIDSCRAFASDGPVVRRRWPDRYTGATENAG